MFWLPRGLSGSLKVVVIGLFVLVLQSCSSGDSSPAGEIQTPETVPLAPGNVSAVSAERSVTISWSPVSGAESYNLYWSTQQGQGVSGTRLQQVNSPYVHQNLSAEVRHYYVVTAVNSVGESGVSIEVEAIPSAPTQTVGRPNPPAMPDATGSDQKVKLNWPADPRLSYRLFWSTTPAVSLSSDFIDDVVPPYVHEGLVNGTTYSYILTASNVGGESLPSAVVSAFVDGPTDVPGVPQGVIVKSTDQGVVINWDPVPFAEYYNIYWSQTLGAGTAGTVISRPLSPYGHKYLTNDATYYYVVTAVNRHGESSPSIEVGATPALQSIANISFNNADLANCVSRAAPSSTSNASELTRLECTLFQGSDIGGIEYLTNLGELLLIITVPHGDLSLLNSLTLLNNLTLRTSRRLTDLTVISNLTTLKTLNLASNQIQDISGLETLTELTSLRIDKNQFYDLSPLSTLTKLQAVHIFENNITDLRPLTNISSMQELLVGSNQLTSLAGIENMTGLTKLFARSNKISDINAMSGLTNLSQVVLLLNEISDIEALTQLQNLTALILSGNKISDVTPLANMNKLTQLELSSNSPYLSNIQSLSGLTSLTSMNLSSNRIRDISPLATLTSIELLELGNNEISFIAALAGLTNLTELGLSYNRIGDLSPLSGLSGLTTLRLSNNGLANLGPLSSLTSLSSINLSNNNIIDISPLNAMIGLQRLDLGYNKIVDVAPLVNPMNLTTLISLTLQRNSLVDVSELAKQTSLQVLDLRETDIGGQGVGNVDSLATLINAVYIQLQANPNMSCVEFATLTASFPAGVVSYGDCSNP